MWILRSFGHGLINLVQFRGRDAQWQFWPYCLLVIVIAHVVFVMAFVPVVQNIVSEMADYVRAHPDQGTITQSDGNYSVEINGFPPEVRAFFKPIMLYPIGLIVAAAVLLAAAVVRRLRDAGKSLWLGLLPLVLGVLGAACLDRIFNQGFDLTLMLGAIVGCFGYLIALLILIITLAAPTASLAPRV